MSGRRSDINDGHELAEKKKYVSLVDMRSSTKMITFGVAGMQVFGALALAGSAYRRWFEQ